VGRRYVTLGPLRLLDSLILPLRYSCVAYSHRLHVVPLLVDYFEHCLTTRVDEFPDCHRFTFPGRPVHVYHTNAFPLVDWVSRFVLPLVSSPRHGCRTDLSWTLPIHRPVCCVTFVPSYARCGCRWVYFDLHVLPVGQVGTLHRRWTCPDYYYYVVELPGQHPVTV